jgi:hypothetical protein
MQNTGISHFQNTTQKPPPGPWPWYVLLFTGFALTGVFPWLMVGLACYYRGKKRIAALTVVSNVVVFIILGWGCLHIRLPWWWMAGVTYFINLVWAGSAWLFQRRLLGPAKRRFALREYKSWIVPILIGLVIGMSTGTLFSVSPALENRMEMRQTIDSLDRETVLWDFFRYSLFGGFWGLLLGIWWAGEGKRFSAGHVIVFLCALALTTIVWLVGWYFLLFLIQGGNTIDTADFNISKWALIAPWVSGIRQYLLEFQAYDMSALLIIPLLFGTVSRIRDFWKRSLLIVLTFFCLLPISFTEAEWWRDIQKKILYELSSPDQRSRKTAHAWAATLLRRYPNHLQWPSIAEDLARFYHDSGQYQKSKSLYLEIADRYGASNRWYWVVERARAAARRPDFDGPATHRKLAIPLVDYEEYLTRNWMALLSAIRYWKGPDVAESQVIIELKSISRSHDRIALTPLENLADLDDAVQSLGYEVVILPADLARVKRLISAGIPVIHPCYTTFNLIYGFDESRSMICAYSFRNLTHTLRKKARDEAKEILAIEEEGRGKSRDRLARIANQSYFEYAEAFWKGPALRYIGPLMAIVFPPGDIKKIADALESDPNSLAKESQGYLATLIGLSYLNQADPVQAVAWARIGANKISDPMPLYVAYLAKVFWQKRKSNIKSNIPLQNQFPELAKIFSYFQKPENSFFFKGAAQGFTTDLEAHRLPWVFSQSYLPMLDRSDPADLEQIIKITQGRLVHNPSDIRSWKVLSRTYEWIDNLAEQAKALRGAVACKPYDSKSKLKLAYSYVLLGQYSEAQAALRQLDSSKVKFDADYPFCLGAVAEWQGKVKEALINYKSAIEMRRYKPVYHLRYGKLLLKAGKFQQARKVLAWAALIDAGESIKNEAQKHLSQIK